MRPPYPPHLEDSHDLSHFEHFDLFDSDYNVLDDELNFDDSEEWEREWEGVAIKAPTA